MKGYRAILALEKEVLDPFKQLEFEFYERYYSAEIKYYLGLHYSNEKKYAEALLILQTVATAVEESVEFAQKNGLMESPRVKKQLKECEEEGGVLKTLGYLISKCHAKLLQQQLQEKTGDKDGDEEMKREEVEKEKGSKVVKIDNLFDMMFDSNGNQKQREQTQMIKIRGDRLDFLDQNGSNIEHIDEKAGSGFEAENMKISK